MNNICDVCNNPYFVLDYRCKICGNILREKVTVINLGEIIHSLLFEIEDGVKKILYAEKKNYVFVLLMLLSIKLTILTLFDVSFIDLNDELKSIQLIFKIFFCWFLFLFLFGVILKLMIFSIKRVNLNLKIIYSLIGYSNLFFSLTTLILFPLELMLFGAYLFSNNPSILEINYFKSVILIIIEILIMLYTIYLLFKFLVFILQQRYLAFSLTILSLFLFYTGNDIIQKIVGIN